MISTLNELVAKEHAADLIAQAARWRFRQTARALLRERTRRTSQSRVDQVRVVDVRHIQGVHDAAIADSTAAAEAYCRRAASPARRVAA
jgi:hypothetical protein